MDTLQCAILLAKLERFEWEIEQRAEVARRYGELMLPLQRHGIRGVTVRADRTSVHAQYTIRAPDRDGLQARLKTLGIPTAVHYPLGLHQQPAYARLCAGSRFPITERLAREVVSLPMHPDLAAGDQRRIADAIDNSLAAAA
jgi:UDP-2-acetamido-2-deoxy-ribo-hexuluronate aminotransferase